MDPVTQSMLYQHMTHFSALLEKLQERVSILATSGYKTKEDVKELNIIQTKFEVCSNAMKLMKKNPPTDPYTAIDQLGQLTKYVHSKEGIL